MAKSSAEGGLLGTLMALDLKRLELSNVKFPSNRWLYGTGRGHNTKIENV